MPFPYHGGVRLADQAQFDPMPFLDSLAVELLERGGRLVEHTRVRRVSSHGKELRVHVNNAAQQDGRDRGRAAGARHRDSDPGPRRLFRAR